MNLKCVFHVRPTSIQTPTDPSGARGRMPSLLDLDIEWVDQPAPRGASLATYTSS